MSNSELVGNLCRALDIALAELQKSGADAKASKTIVDLLEFTIGELESVEETE